MELLPALLHIKATAILDDALTLWLQAHGHALSKPYRNDLNGPLTYLADRSTTSELLRQA